MIVQRPEPPLFWNARGKVACQAHAPYRDSEQWRVEGWEPLSADVIWLANASGGVLEHRMSSRVCSAAGEKPP